VTPVPLELPLRPAEAAELANLVFDHAEGKHLSDDVRNRLAARAAALRLQTISTWFGSLERDPVHRSAYYLAVDASEPLLLHMALAAAPTSSIYHKPLLIGRMRRPNGAEMVINAIPFGPHARQNVETFAARVNPAFYPQPQGARTTITVEEDYPAAFDTFRAIQKRTGKNFAALSGDCHAAMHAAIRAGWRSPYTVATDLTVEAPGIVGREGFSRYTVALPATIGGLEQAEKVYQQIRNARAFLKNTRGFDLELDAAGPVTPQFLRDALEFMKVRGHLPQLVCPGPVGEADFDEIAAAARHFQVTLGFRYGGEPAETVRAIARAMAGRLDYRVRNAAEAELVGAQLL
jgi:hypothetical protein